MGGNWPFVGRRAPIRGARGPLCKRLSIEVKRCVNWLWPTTAVIKSSTPNATATLDLCRRRFGRPRARQARVATIAENPARSATRDPVSNSAVNKAAADTNQATRPRLLAATPPSATRPNSTKKEPAVLGFGVKADHRCPKIGAWNIPSSRYPISPGRLERSTNSPLCSTASGSAVPAIRIAMSTSDSAAAPSAAATRIAVRRRGSVRTRCDRCKTARNSPIPSSSRAVVRGNRTHSALQPRASRQVIPRDSPERGNPACPR